MRTHVNSEDGKKRLFTAHDWKTTWTRVVTILRIRMYLMFVSMLTRRFNISYAIFATRSGLNEPHFNLPYPVSQVRLQLLWVLAMSWKPIQIDQPIKPVCKNRNRSNIKCRKSCCKRVRALQQNPDSSEQQSLFYKEGPLQQLRNWRNYPESN